MSDPDEPSDAPPASENTSQSRRQGGKGEPFRPGEAPSGAKPWTKGQRSPNPGGRPKNAPEHRARCRAWAELALEQLGARIEAGELSDADLIRAYESLADRGGYLSGDRLAAAEAARWRMGFQAFALGGITLEQRKQILLEVMRHEQEALGEPGRAAKGDDGGDENSAADAPGTPTKSLPVDPR